MTKMGRPRQFDEQEVLKKSMMLFWEKGYEAVSLTDLETATGLKRVSLYNAIGDKEAIFVKVMDTYTSMAKTMLSDSIINSDIEGLKAFFNNMTVEQPEGSPSNWGCLMVNSVLDVKQFSDVVKNKVSNYRQVLIEAFKQNLLNSRKKGLINSSDREIDSMANYLLTTFWGILTTIRLFGSTAAIKPAVEILSSTINSWKI